MTRKLNRILVTGGAGYIGSILVPRLLNEGCEVVVIDNLMYNQSALLDCCHNDKFTIVRGDTRDKELLARYIKDVDAILPLACLTGAPLCQKFPVEAETIIVDAIKMIIELSSKDQAIIYPTTNSGYGIGEKGKHCTEETPLRPISLYGKLKVEAERLILERGNGITLRLATAFGVSPRMRLDLLVNDFTYRAVYDRFLVLFEAHFNRNFCHVRDISDAFVHCLRNFDKMKDQAYNVGLSEANLNKQELCKEIKEFVPDFYFIEADVGSDPDKRDYIVSNAKIESTGFKASRSIQSGIKELIKGYQIIKRNQYSNV